MFEKETSSYKMLARFFFYPSLGYTYLLSSVSSRRKWYNRLDETVILGALPLRSVTRKLVDEENVKGLVTLNESYEMKHITCTDKELSLLGVERLHIPTIDLTGSPSQESLLRAVDFIQTHRKNGNSVYVHCKAGRTRSTTVAMCYLMKEYSQNPKKAHEFIKLKRPHIWLRQKQWDSIHQFYNNHCSDSL